MALEKYKLHARYNKYPKMIINIGGSFIDLKASEDYEHVIAETAKTPESNVTVKAPTDQFIDKLLSDESKKEFGDYSKLFTNKVSSILDLLDSNNVNNVTPINSAEQQLLDELENSDKENNSDSTKVEGEKPNTDKDKKGNNKKKN